MGTFKVNECEKWRLLYFDLPKHFKIYNTINSPLYDSENHQIGNFTVTKDGKVTMTFNDYVEEHPDVAGNLQLKTEFNKAEIKGTTTQEIPFPIKDKDVSITVDFKPNVQTATNKKDYLIDQLIQMKLIGK